jgi:hypothetical protein
MKPKILSWNVKWLNKEEKRMKIKGLIKGWKANIVCLQENKLKFINREVVFSLWDSVHEDWCYLGSSGIPGGILLMWDRRVVEKVEDCVRRFIVVFFSVCK